MHRSLDNCPYGAVDIQCNTQTNLLGLFHSFLIQYNRIRFFSSLPYSFFIHIYLFFCSSYFFYTIFLLFCFVCFLFLQCYIGWQRKKNSQTPDWNVKSCAASVKIQPQLGFSLAFVSFVLYILLLHSALFLRFFYFSFSFWNSIHFD